jgi:GntR family transcriptional regulator/MocR family aminotransferase
VLPTSRLLAEELRVSRGVVVDSYAQLTAEGYLSAKQGSGTRVAYRASPWGMPGRRQLSPPAKFRFDFRPGQADFHSFPRARWQAALIRALRELPDARLSYASHRGVPELRNAIGEYVARVRGVVVEPERVVVCCGVSHGLSALWHALRERGARRIGIEDPGWRWQRYTVEHAGLEAVPVRVDGDGLVVSELEACNVDAVVLTPAHQYPTGVVMTAERRSALIAWARKHETLIVEDDYDAEYRFDRDPVVSLQGLAPDAVAFLGTTSKMLAPALRLAWMVLPSPLLDDVEHELLVTGATPPTVDQMALASVIAEGGLERHLRLMRRHYRAKRDLMIQQLARRLPDARVSRAVAGLHLLLWLPEGSDERETAIRARRAGVGVHELHRHCTVRAPVPPALVLGFALPTESEIRAGTELLATAVG